MYFHEILAQCDEEDFYLSIRAETMIFFGPTIKPPEVLEIWTQIQNQRRGFILGGGCHRSPLIWTAFAPRLFSHFTMQTMLRSVTVSVRNRRTRWWLLLLAWALTLQNTTSTAEKREFGWTAKKTTPQETFDRLTPLHCEKIAALRKWF